MSHACTNNGPLPDARGVRLALHAGRESHPLALWAAGHCLQVLLLHQASR
jgi:hypothetical protein